MRARDGCTPLESLELLVTLLRDNDNCENSLADDYYVAQVCYFAILVGKSRNTLSWGVLCYLETLIMLLL